MATRKQKELAKEEILAEQEDIIQDAIAMPFEIGFALRKIRDLELFKVTHTYFEEYVRERWKITKSGAYAKIKCAEVMEILVQAELPVLDNEAQATELARLSTKVDKRKVLDAAKIKEVWEEANEQEDRAVTQMYLREIIKQKYGEKKSSPSFSKQLDKLEKDIQKFRKNLAEESVIPADVLKKFGSIYTELDALRKECESLATRTDEAGKKSGD